MMQLKVMQVDEFATIAPRNVLGVQSAVISLLAGDVFRVGSVHRRLYFFRAIYYFNCLISLPTALRAWRNRKRVIAPVSEAA